ncbi:excalibur calcium-binding domain-containing protein [Arthrobacter gengyunqii]|uniref:Excalibur calcium-binding domain-containing protein n=2 Tax=Arthrobacter gengyunqii TaxID=2886940 RepID=A0ABS8GIV8_9MICC|nr:excalibur calcium-binding domain-containing protein [Arthrobacter gengyunqii]MCC3266293.1 excalibur calcium-binding domain-containing protein [Arthrobacter gengyunqii]
MKKRTAGLALAAVTGLSALTATPAFAMSTPYPNCDAAAADGLYNIPAGDPRYAPNLDRDNDGLACDGPGGTPSKPVPETQPTQPPTPTDTGMPMPEGGVDAGVATEKGTDFGSVALAGGFILAAAGAGTYVIRRRSENHA